MTRYTAVALALLFTVAASGQDDSEGCKDHPLFNRLPNFRIAECETKQFDLKRYPVGPPLTGEIESKTKTVDVEGPYFRLLYSIKEGATKPSPLQVMRNFQSAARTAGGMIMGEYPGACKAALDETLHDGNACINFGVSMKFTGGGKETWAFMQPIGDGESYILQVSERQAMKQDITANHIREALDKEGFLALYLNFETGSAKIMADSLPQLDQVAQATAAAPELKVEVAGHTDNVGSADSNLKLSEARARSVVGALVARNVGAARLKAAGYGATKPIADNRTEEGRAKNRRVELVKQK